MCGCLGKFSELKVVTTTTTTENFIKENLTLSVSADKQIYHSGDKINVSVKIESSIFIEDAIVKVYGIYAGSYRIEDTKDVIIYPGKRELSFAFTTPRCYGCSGISPGVYNLSVEVIYAGSVLKSKTINLTVEQ